MRCWIKTNSLAVNGLYNIAGWKLWKSRKPRETLRTLSGSSYRFVYFPWWADNIYVICRSLVQARCYGSCLLITFPPIPNNIRLDKDSYLPLLKLINKCNQIKAVSKSKAIQSCVLLTYKINKDNSPPIEIKDRSNAKATSRGLLTCSHVHHMS